ncbi:hypothetical protein TCAL_11018 [Tigriopus californicus]|uniref:BTB domain-containing protein n=1 Tax=Tigriopus californicus TaxID=6832 RepID=A0A553NSZ5_TIGCA|nr:gastrula zinc finger protein XlCGF26.1-like [Tigriopus californicus]TRY68552.1 hypothetical protein TCAL_11018 [Tigriopus californicus]|eukprot:TCALIF_11018-PA protein Name:"Similar to Znf879 Zinc finger protein 879 (Mus musculus)" AED:0.22 eAED:0.22 QI:0/-1/0/1/-1/1/1/0/451
MDPTLVYDASDTLALFQPMRSFSRDGKSPDLACPPNVKIWAGSSPTPITAHRLILGSVSQFLHSLLLSSAPWDSSSCFILPDYEPIIVQSVLELLYCGSAVISMSQNSQILQCLDMLGVKCEQLSYIGLNDREANDESKSRDCAEPWLTYKCTECGKTLKSRRNFDNHMALHHPMKLKCHKCPEKFLSPNRLRYHMQSVHLNLAFACSICTKAFRRKIEATSHFKKYHPGEAFQSNVSIIRTKTTALTKRSTTSQATKPGVKTLGNKCSDTEETKHTVAKRFPCSTCQKPFNTRWALNRHMLTHNKSLSRKMYLCQTCGQSFDRYDPYYHHKLRHAPTQDLPTCSTCEKPFANAASLRNHMKGVHGEGDNQSFDCPICGKVFTYKANLKVHTYQHKGEKPFLCEICQARFLRREQLQNHQKIHERQDFDSIDELVDHFNDFKRSVINEPDS